MGKKSKGIVSGKSAPITKAEFERSPADKKVDEAALAKINEKRGGKGK